MDVLPFSYQLTLETNEPVSEAVHALAVSLVMSGRPGDIVYATSGAVAVREAVDVTAVVVVAAAISLSKINIVTDLLISIINDTATRNV
jgi:hypothetical protein